MAESFRVLVVYESFPDATNAYLVDMTEDEFGQYSKLAGFVANADDFTPELWAIHESLDKARKGWKEISLREVTRVNAYVLWTGFML